MTNLILRTPALMGRNAFDQLFDQFFNDPAPVIKRSTDGYPLTDIYKDEEGQQIIEMALAGFNKKDINIEIKENTITISYHGKPWRGEDSPVRRIARRSFSKKFVDYDNQLNLLKASATFENGLLKVSIPKVAEKQSTLIDIK